jgi:hypothetical protein
MHSCRIRLTARASWKKRSTSELCSDQSREITLMATRLPIAGCTARNTSPIPPAPMRAAIR